MNSFSRRGVSMHSFLRIVLLEERIVLDAAAGSVIFVDANNVGSVHNGSSWQTAFLNLQDALNVAAQSNGPDQIWVADGTYKPGLLSTDTYNLPDKVALYGGFSGSETKLSQRNVTANLTVLSGNIGALNTNLDNVQHIVTVDNANATIDGFTIRDAYNPIDSGGGILVTNDSNLTVANDTFLNNIVVSSGSSLIFDHMGGAIAVFNSDLTVSDSVFQDNSAKMGGAIGALSLDASDFLIKVTSSVFTNNDAQASGGAIAVSGLQTIGFSFTRPIAGNLLVQSSLFENNTATLTSGAIFTNDTLTTVIKDTSFISNEAAVLAGGAIHPQGNRQVIIDNSIFIDNSASVNGFGGAISDSLNDMVKITNSYFSGNIGFAGGALDLEPSDGHILISKNTFVNNIATAWGAALFTFEDGKVDVINNVFQNNTAGEQGGAIWDDGSLSYNIRGNAFTGNTAPEGPSIYLAEVNKVNGSDVPGSITSSLVKTNSGLQDDGVLIV